MLQVGDLTVSIDETKVLANASKHSAVSYGHCVEQMKPAEEQIAELLQKAEDESASGWRRWRRRLSGCGGGALQI